MKTQNHFNIKDRTKFVAKIARIDENLQFKNNLIQWVSQYEIVVQQKTESLG